MSRIGKQPVNYPAGVKVQVADGKVRVEGPKGKLEFDYHRDVTVEHDDKSKVIRISPRKCARCGNPSRTRVREFVMTVSRCAARRASPSPAVAPDTGSP